MRKNHLAKKYKVEINIKRPHEKQNESGPASNRNVIERNIESGVESSTDEIDLKKKVTPISKPLPQEVAINSRWI